MSSPAYNQSNQERISLQEQIDHWERFGERDAFRTWILSWEPNLFVNLVPQDRRLTAEHVGQIATRWCNKVHKECFPRNPRKRIGKFAILVEHDSAVGWHSHGVGLMPSSLIGKVVENGERWLVEQTAAYLDHNHPRLPDDVRSRTPSAVLRSINPSQESAAVTNYAMKFWLSHGKSEHLVLSGFHSSRA